MRILWVCNLPINPICQALGIQNSGGGGWIEGLYTELLGVKDIDLYICYPDNKGFQTIYVKGAKCFSFFQPRNIVGMANTTRLDKRMRADINRILKEAAPEILHIFGTEFPHSRIFAEEFNDGKRTVVNIQGLSSMIGERYSLGIPNNVCHKINFSSIVRKTISGQQSTMIKRGTNERVTLKLTENVIGRTEWDLFCAKEINPSIHYYHCGENLRPIFYKATKWNYDLCDRHTIFVSQGNYPVKGLHILIKALGIVSRRIPDVKLIVAGSNPLQDGILTRRLLRSTYADYLKKLIKANNLEDKIKFTGNLNEDEMVVQYQKANIYILPSVIENSPNSLCEAMYIGTPSLAADVGGVSSIIGNIEYVYCYDDYHYLAGKIESIFDMKESVSTMSSKLIMQSSLINDRSNNLQELLNIYGQIAK